jgi:hypothetical protein
MVDIFLTFLPSYDLHYPSCTEDDIYFKSLSVGNYHRIFILSDYDYCYSFCAVPVIPTHPDDHWVTNFSPKIYCASGIKNQTELADPKDCSSNGVNPPCYISYYPIFKTIKGIDSWTGIYFNNTEFPKGSSCPIE